MRSVKSDLFISYLKKGEINQNTENGNSAGIRIGNFLDITTQNNQVIITARTDSPKFSDITFNKGDVFEKDIVFEGGNFNKIIFRGGTFKGNLIFRNGVYNSFVSIRGGTFEKKIAFVGGEFKHWVGTLSGQRNKTTHLNKLISPKKI